MPIAGVLRDRLEHDSRERRGDIRVREAGRHRRRAVEGLGQLLHATRLVGGAARQQLVKNHAERVDIGPKIGRHEIADDADLFRGEVGQVLGRDRESIDPLAQGIAMKTPYLHRAVGGDEDPGGVQRAVQQAHAVRGDDSFGRLAYQRDRLRHVQGRMLLAIPAEVASRHVLHHDGHAPVRARLEAVDPHDVGMDKLGGELYCLFEGLFENLTRKQLGIDDLDRHGATSRVLPLVDRSQRAVGDLVSQTGLAERLAGVRIGLFGRFLESQAVDGTDPVFVFPLALAKRAYLHTGDRSLRVRANHSVNVLRKETSRRRSRRNVKSTVRC